MNDYGTGWNRKERLLVNLINAIRIEEDAEKRKEYQNMINEITKPRCLNRVLPTVPTNSNSEVFL